MVVFGPDFCNDKDNTFLGEYLFDSPLKFQHKLKIGDSTQADTVRTDSLGAQVPGSMTTTLLAI